MIISPISNNNTFYGRTQNKSVNPSTENQIVEPDPYRFLAKVTVNGVTSNIDNSIQPENIKVGASILGVNR